VGSSFACKRTVRSRARPSFSDAETSPRVASKVAIGPGAAAFVAMYKPNFCAECGKKLLRLHWLLWNSRKFCDECARRLRKKRLAPIFFTILALFAAGFVVGRSRRPAPPPLIIQRRADSPLSDGGATQRAKAGTPPAPAVEEAVYICGARTKKGTPCSRRVHGPVRCWQHKGMPAMLPQEKLRVN